MRLAMIVLILMTVGGIAAGYFGVADEIADAFKWVALSSFCAFIVTSLMRRISSPDSRQAR